MELLLVPFLEVHSPELPLQVVPKDRLLVGHLDVAVPEEVVVVAQEPLAHVEEGLVGAIAASPAQPPG